MKFICEKKILLHEIHIAQEVISNRSFDIKSNVYLIASSENKLTIKATDLKIHFEVNIPLEVEIPGSTTVSADKLLKILNTFKEDKIIFSLDDNILDIRPESGKSDYNLKCLDPENFPAFRESDKKNEFELPQKTFVGMFSQVVSSVSTDESRYFLTGIYMEKRENKLILVATDGKRLSYVDFDVEIPDFNPVIIPVKILKLIQKLSSGEGNIKLSIEEKAIYFDFDNNHFYSTLIEGNYPDYKKVIPNEFVDKTVISKEDFVNALKGVSIMAEEKSGRIEINFSKENIKIKGKESNYGSGLEIITSEGFQGDEITLEFNYLFFLDSLKEMKSDQVELQFAPGYKPIVITSYPAENYFHVFMPMQN